MSSPILFSDLQLIDPIQRAVSDKGYTEPSPIQARCIPTLLEGRDLIGCAQTGTGKTAAFALPILQHLAADQRPRTPKSPRALILTPTRELAAQIGDNFATYGKHLKLRHLVIFGGVGQNPQVTALRQGVDILVATPGRLLDLKQQGAVRFDQVQIFVLDEADRMLDMGFVHDVKKVLAVLPPKRQSLLFSATMPPAIAQLAQSFLNNPAKVEVTPAATTAERISQELYYVRKDDKRELLVDRLKAHPKGLVLVFVRMKHGANRIVEFLDKQGIRAAAIHGNKSQTARERALEGFRNGTTRVLVATDIAARGIDVKGVSLVINYEIPNEAESYVHRIGRTARAGADGVAISFCDSGEMGYIKTIEKLTRSTLPVIADHPLVQTDMQPTAPEKPGGGGRRFGGGGGGQNRRSGGRPQGKSASGGRSGNQRSFKTQRGPRQGRSSHR